MAQVLSPDGTLQQGNWTGDHTALDETTPLDTDFAYSQDNPNGSTFELSLSNPAQTPGAGDLTISYRYSQVVSGGVDTGGGTQTSLNVSLYQGATLIASDVQQSPGLLFTTRVWTFAAAGITDWTDLRVVAVASGGGGSPSKRRGVALSWLSVSVPDAPAGNPGNASGLFGGAATSTPLGGAGVGRAAVTAALAAAVTITAMGGAGSATGTATGALAGVTVSAMVGSASGGSTQAGNAAGALGEAAALSPMAGVGGGAGNATGTFADLAISAPTGDVGGRGSASAPFGGQVTLSALSGASTGAGAVSAALPPLSVSAMSGSAEGGSGSFPGNASGGFALASVTPMGGTATGGASAMGPLVSVSITALGGGANQGTVYIGQGGLPDIRQRIAALEALHS